VPTEQGLAKDLEVEVEVEVELRRVVEVKMLKAKVAQGEEAVEEESDELQTIHLFKNHEWIRRQ
jgi:hypothetical protein